MRAEKGDLGVRVFLRPREMWIASGKVADDLPHFTPLIAFREQRERRRYEAQRIMSRDDTEHLALDEPRNVPHISRRKATHRQAASGEETLRIRGETVAPASVGQGFPEAMAIDLQYDSRHRCRSISVVPRKCRAWRHEASSEP